VRATRKNARQVSPVFATRAPSENAANRLARGFKLLFEPAIECKIEEGPAGVFRGHFKQRVDPGFDRSLTQKVGAEGVNGTYP
jgi:hypothetical protein